jgi:hypothetical protein
MWFICYFICDFRYFGTFVYNLENMACFVLQFSYLGTFIYNLENMAAYVLFCWFMVHA